MRKILTFLFLLALIIAVIAAGIFLLSRSNLVGGSQPTQLVISAPDDGSAVPLHSTIPVVAEANSEIGMRAMELWINGQQWAAVELQPGTRSVREVWNWTPSAEGRHVLSLRAREASGRLVESATINVFAAAQLDVTFPLDVTAQGGETLGGLAATYGADPGAIAASNPDLDPAVPLSPGQQLTLPIPIGNAPPAGPQDGGQPVAPAGPLPGSGNQAPGGAAAPGDAPIDLSQSPGFQISDGVIILKVPVQQIYAYVSLADQPWFRIPAGEFNFLQSSGNTFDLKPHLNPEMTAGLPSPTSFKAAVWGWAGGQLVFLGQLNGVLGGDLGPLLNLSLIPTRLDIVGRIRDSVTYESQWTIPSPIPGYFQGYKQGFRWTTSLEGVTGGIWQISSKPFPAAPLWAFPGQMNFGKVPPPQTVTTQFEDWLGVGDVQTELKPAAFTLDFAPYLDLPPDTSESGGFGDFGDIFGDLEQAVNDLTKPQIPTRIVTVEFYVRVIPVIGSKLGEPSNTVMVHYGPPEEQLITPETGPLYDVEVLEFTPYRAADYDYQACMVLTQDIQVCQKQYSLNPFTLAQQNDHIQNVLKQAAASGNLGSYKYQYPDVIIEKQVCNTVMPKGTQSCGCPGVSCSSGGSSCELSLSGIGHCIGEGFEAGWEAVRDFTNWVSTAYADIKASVVTFIVENTPIGDLCKEVVGVAGGGSDECKTIVRAAIDYGLAACGIPPSIPNFDQLVAQGEDYLIEAAAEELRAQGIPCDSTCEDALREGYDKVKEGMSDSGSGGGSANPQFVPHPLAVEQPAMLRVQLTRRPETAAIPATAASSCKLFVWNGATNTSYGQTLEGAPFAGVGLGIPPLEPGESITIPITLDRMAWNPPAGFTLPPPQPGDVLQAVVLDPATGQPFGVGAWSLLYEGSTINFLIRSPGITVAGANGELVSLPCLEKFDYPVQIPMP